MNPELLRAILAFYQNPATQRGFLQFFSLVQQEGMEAARKFWESSASGEAKAVVAPELLEQMISFYSSLGFVPKRQFDEVVKENESLKKENEFLKKTIQEVNFKVFEEGSSRMHDVWKDVMTKQMDLNKELAKGFLDLFTQSKDKDKDKE